MAMTMFAMVITTVVVMSIVIQATQTLVDAGRGTQRPASTFNSTRTLLSFFDPVTDLQAAINERAPVVASAVEAVGRLGKPR